MIGKWDNKEMEMEAGIIRPYVSCTVYPFFYFSLSKKKINTRKFKFNIQNNLFLMNHAKCLDNGEVRTANINFPGDNFIFFHYK